MSGVKVGQIWADNDPRVPVRELEVIGIDCRFAYVRNTETGKPSRIALNRFKPTKTGYRLIQEVEG